MTANAERAHPAEYQCWRAMRQRCMSPGHKFYEYYGGRGITICERWNKFENFYADLGSRPSSGHSLERIRNNGPYSPRNCCWATKKEQQNNTRHTILLKFKGEKRPLRYWAKELGIKSCTLYSRVQRLKWPVARAMTEPVR